VIYKRPDHFTRKAREQGFAARSVFKLDEIDARTHVVPGSGIALDLGCFPGSWSRWLQQRGLRVRGVDLQAPAFEGEWIVRSVMDVTPDQIGPVALVCSDMAPNTTGNRLTDHCRQLELAERALTLAVACLEPTGGFVCKVFDGQDAPAFVARVEAALGPMRRLKPEATRGRSVEFFLAGRRRGAPAP
jgi:23S rRNA (uridine2552-2'-O)-methyltransferase